MVKRDLADRLELVAPESEQRRVDDEVVGVAVVLLVLDQMSDVVEERRGLEPPARLRPQPETDTELVEQT